MLFPIWTKRRAIGYRPATLRTYTESLAVLTAGPQKTTILSGMVLCNLHRVNDASPASSLTTHLTRAEFHRSSLSIGHAPFILQSEPAIQNG